MNIDKIDINIVRKKLEYVANYLGMIPRGQDGLEAVEYSVLLNFNIPAKDVHIVWGRNTITRRPYWEVNVSYNK